MALPVSAMLEATALLRPEVLVAEAPRLPPGERNWESAQAEAAVVASLRENLVVEAMLSQRPRGTARVMPEFAGAGLTEPPRATR